MFATFKMVLVYVTLGGLAGLVGIPYSLAVGNVRRLYRVSMWIIRAGVRAAGRLLRGPPLQAAKNELSPDTCRA